MEPRYWINRINWILKIGMSVDFIKLPKIHLKDTEQMFDVESFETTEDLENDI